MTAVFADTSALYAFLDGDDGDHPAVVCAWDELAETDHTLVTTNYVLLETSALVQRRLGLQALRRFSQYVAPLFDVVWVEAIMHEAGVAALLTANRRELSLVDCVSLDVMRRLGLRQALTLDAHFREQGFDCLPAPEP